jgi:hypothetical protein
MRKPYRNGHVLEQFTAHATHKCFAQLRMVVSTRDNQVGGEIGGAREQNLRYRNVTLQRFFGFGWNPVPLEMTGNPL